MKRIKMVHYTTKKKNQLNTKKAVMENGRTKEI